MQRNRCAGEARLPSPLMHGSSPYGQWGLDEDSPVARYAPLGKRLAMDVLVFFINKVLIAGTVLGSIYALGAIGVTLIFGILRFAHFAHGDMMTLGAFFAFLLSLLFYHYGITFPIPVGFVVLPVAMLITIAGAAARHRQDGLCACSRRRGAKPVTLLIASIGVTLMLQGLIRLFFGTGTYSFFDYGDPKVIFKLDMDWAGSRPITFTEPQLLMVDRDGAADRHPQLLPDADPAGQGDACDGRQCRSGAGVGDQHAARGARHLDHRGGARLRGRHDAVARTYR